MPMLRRLTMKIKTALAPPEAPSAGTSPSSSASSFEVVSREKRPRGHRLDTESSAESFGCVDARAVVEELEKLKLERGEKRRSKFREEF